MGALFAQVVGTDVENLVICVICANYSNIFALVLVFQLNCSSVLLKLNVGFLELADYIFVTTELFYSFSDLFIF